MGISSSNSIPALLAYIIVFVSSNGEGDGVRNVLIPVHGVVLTSILYKLLLLLVASNNVGVVSKICFSLKWWSFRRESDDEVFSVMNWPEEACSWISLRN